MEFSNQGFIVTGGAQGIGRTVALELAESGAKVAVLDTNASALEQTLPLLRQISEDCKAVVCDVSNKNQVQQSVRAIADEWKAIHGLVNVAGTLALGSIEDLTDQQWQQCFAVNMFGVLNLCRAVIPFLKQQPEAAIVTVGSNAGTVPRKNMAAYAASKAACHQFMRTLGLELAPKIRCNIVAPGSTDTPMQQMLGTEEKQRQKILHGSNEDFRLGIPLGKIAEPLAVADVILFLLSKKARHLTMETITVDGGASLGL
jgi:2,3-dihydro-2,3-dihydroxybenzoate dehydrogenase